MEKKYIRVEYPKWINTIDNKRIIVNNKEEELNYTKKEAKNEPIKNNSEGLNPQSINPSGSDRPKRKPKQPRSE